MPGATALHRHTGVVTKVMALHYGRADAVITPTAGMMDVLNAMKVRNPVVIPTSIDPRALNAAPAVENPWPAGKQRLLSVGRLAREKRFDHVLDTLAGLPDAHLVILGEGPERDHLEAHAARIGVGATEPSATRAVVTVPDSSMLRATTASVSAISTTVLAIRP